MDMEFLEVSRKIIETKSAQHSLLKAYPAYASSKLCKIIFGKRRIWFLRVGVGADLAEEEKIWRSV